MMLAVVAVMLACAAVLFAFGNALGAKGRHQRAAELAAISAAQMMRDLYPRLFEPPLSSRISRTRDTWRNPSSARSLSRPPSEATAGMGWTSSREMSPSPARGFAPTRVTVRVRANARVRLPGKREATRVVAGGVTSVPIRAQATRMTITPTSGPFFWGAGQVGLNDH